MMLVGGVELAAESGLPLPQVPEGSALATAVRQGSASQLPACRFDFGLSRTAEKISLYAGACGLAPLPPRVRVCLEAERCLQRSLSSTTLTLGWPYPQP